MPKPPKILFGPFIPIKFLPVIPGTIVSVTKNYEELKKSAQVNDFNCIVTPLFIHNKSLGLEFLQDTKYIYSKKIVCTEERIKWRQLIEDLNGIVLSLKSLPTLNALAFSNSPIKREGKILINLPSYQAMWMLPKELQKNLIEKIFPDVIVNTYTENEFLTELHLNRFKLIIDISTATFFSKNEENIIENIFREFTFNEIPRLIILKDKLTLVKNIYQILKNEQTSKA